MIPFSYEVIESTTQGMVIRYSSPGRDSIDIGTHAPTPEESVEAIAFQYSPVPFWLSQEKERVIVPLGTSGSFQPPEAPTVTLESAKKEKLEELAAWRFGKETGGVLVGGVRIKTDRESQATVTGAFISLSQGLATSIDWKAEGGVWVPLTLAQITPIAQAVVAHVQSCFTAEKVLTEEINALTSIEEVRAFQFPEVIA